MRTDRAFLAAYRKALRSADPAAREIVYGEPYESWKAKHQKEAAPAANAAFDAQHSGR